MAILRDQNRLLGTRARIGYSLSKCSQNADLAAPLLDILRDKKAWKRQFEDAGAPPANHAMSALENITGKTGCPDTLAAWEAAVKEWEETRKGKR